MAGSNGSAIVTREVLMLIGEHGGDPMMANIAMLRAL
jgi:hypothetical protein